MVLRAGVFITILGFIFQSAFCNIQSPEVSFNPERGYYNKPFRLSLSCSDPTAVIVFTTDCSIPSGESGKVYRTDFEITSTTVVKATAYAADNTSVTVTHTYLFPDDLKNQGKNPAGYPATWGGSSTITADYEMDPAIVNNQAYSGKINDALQSIPLLSLSMPVDEWFNHNTGLYVGYPNSNITREKPVAAEFIYADSSQNFGINCSVQNQGGTSIVNWKVPKQSMRLKFKEQYGPKKLKKKLFHDSDIESINTLVVDGFLYSWVHPSDATQRKTSLFFRDQLCSDLQNDMGGLSFHGIYVNLFINGLYWGMYDLHERPDEDFMAEYYDSETTDFDVIKHNPNTVVSGSKESYQRLLREARTGFTAPGSLENIEKYLDLPLFIDYMILNYYLGNTDWAHQNYYAAINNTLATGYRFYTWDAEHVMRFSNVNDDVTQRVDKGGPTEIHSLLKANAEYRMMFADAFFKHVFNNGALSIENFEKQFLYRKNEIDLAVILESARWGDYRKASSGITYTRNDHWIPEVNKVITEYIPKRRDIVIKQLQRSDNRLYPETSPPFFSTSSGELKTEEPIEIKDPNTNKGTIFYTTDGSDPRKQGGAVGGSMYQAAFEINDALLIKARVLNSGTDEWSPLVEGYFVPENILRSLMITEIMYNSGYDNLEFIELMNAGNRNINLIGISFTKGIEYTFQHNLVLKPGRCIVLTNNMELFEALYRFKAYDVYNKKLSNSGETIILSNYFSAVIDSVTWSDSAPWPASADGKGWSLELISTDKDNALAPSWRASNKLYGTPQEFFPGNQADINQQFTAKAMVYPNPATNRINLVFPDQEFKNEDVLIEFYNLSGQLTKRIIANFYGSNFQIDISDLNAGVYQLRIKSRNKPLKPETFKLIILE